MCRWLDIPFFLDQWTRIDAGKRTLRQYAKILRSDASYDALDWTSINEKWRIAQTEGKLEDEIPAITEHWRYQMRKKWPAEMERTDDDYQYLETLYDDLCATQNLATATQRDDAKRLCEIGLLINKKIRSGLDAKNEMAMYHNIVKTEGFEPKNAKNAGDFDSTGELFAWLEKRGWRPNFHSEPQDSVDFTIKNMQKYLQRLVLNEGTLGDQVENRRSQLRVAAKLEEDDNPHAVTEPVEVEYEGAAELEEEINALN